MTYGLRDWSREFENAITSTGLGSDQPDGRATDVSVADVVGLSSKHVARWRSGVGVKKAPGVGERRRVLGLLSDYAAGRVRPELTAESRSAFSYVIGQIERVIQQLRDEMAVRTEEMPTPPPPPTQDRQPFETVMRQNPPAATPESAGAAVPRPAKKKTR